MGMKRLVDIVGAGVALVVLLPLIAVIALAIRTTSPGPAIFRQRRLGRNGSPFDLYKFRSMRVNAPDVRNADGSAYSGDGDPRVTPFGRFIRQTSLDELPQLYNVMKGDMSLVGPRPDQVDQLRFYDEGEKRKLLVKPGITGLAQISGRNDIPWKMRKALDVRYVEERSLALDFEILLRTIPYVLLRKGIHTGVSPQA
jgi:undecaprenyl phosphate N,N'-diacetylbacillosamine 1-phosphate transferase